MNTSTITSSDANSPPRRRFRKLRYLLIALATFCLTVAFFYAEEDLRGWLAWKNCKTALEAKGVVLDWNAYIPPPVPDDQNFFKAPKMTDWFVRQIPWLNLTHELQSKLDSLYQQHPYMSPATIAELTVLPVSTADAASQKADIVLRYDSHPSPDVRERLVKLFADAIGPNAASCNQPMMILARPPGEIKPVRIVFHSDAPPGTNEMKEFFTKLLLNDKAYSNTPRIHIEPDGTNTFRVTLDSASAADYLASSDTLEPDFDLIREALKRPYARIDGDYSIPLFYTPMPNFITVRTVSQALAERTKCDLLLGQPDKALQELTLMHDMCRILERPPAGKPITLVEAMLNVAVTGLYTETVEDGMRLHAWQEPQLAALQKQFAGINLPPFVVDGFRVDTASYSRFFGEAARMDSDDVERMFGFSKSWKWANLKNSYFWLLYVAPRGWIYQNIVNVAVLQQKPLEGFDLAHDTISPVTIAEAAREVDAFDKSARTFRPYKLLAAISIPNFIRAYQTTAHNQTMANEAQIVCALERYHLAHGEYPQALDALLPQFIEKIPHDIIGGQALHYRRTDDGKFLLYSVGWDEKDDGGVDSSQIKNDKGYYAEGDWVWLGE